jgi:TolB-like protein
MLRNSDQPVTGPPPHSCKLRLEEEEKEHRPETSPETSENAEGDHEPGATPWARRWLGVSGFAVLALLGLLTRGRTVDATQHNIKSLAVLPLKNLSGDPAEEYLADGMTESIIGRLSMIRGFRVISRTSVMGFKETHAPVPEIAKTLGVDAIVEGSVIREGGRVRVHAQLIRAATDEHFWSETYDRKLGDALVLESEVAPATAGRGEVTVTGAERARLVAARQVSPEVYESYLKGQFTGEKGNIPAAMEKSIAYFEEAIEKDPAFAPAYLGLAQAYDRLGQPGVGGAPPGDVRRKVINAARKALELDPDLPGVHNLVVNRRIHESTRSTCMRFLRTS